MKTQKCPDCGFKISDSKEWDSAFKMCRICTELLVEETERQMEKDGEEDSIPEIMTDMYKKRTNAFVTTGEKKNE